MMSTEPSVEPASATYTSTGTSCAKRESSAWARNGAWFSDGTATVTSGAVIGVRASARRFGRRAARDEIAVREREAFLQPHARAPAQRVQPAHVHELAWRAVGPGRIEFDAAAV